MSIIELTQMQFQAIESGEAVRVQAPEIGGDIVLLRAEKFESMRNQLEGREKPDPQEASDVPPGILRSQQAFWRDLPELLKNKRNHGQWVCYHGDERVGIARTKIELIRECLRRGFQDDECDFDMIKPHALPPWEPEDIDPRIPEASEGEVFDHPFTPS